MERFRALMTSRPTPASPSWGALHVGRSFCDTYIPFYISFQLFLIFYSMTYLKSSDLRPCSWNWGAGGGHGLDLTRWSSAGPALAPQSAQHLPHPHLAFLACTWNMFLSGARTTVFLPPAPLAPLPPCSPEMLPSHVHPPPGLSFALGRGPCFVPGAPHFCPFWNGPAAPGNCPVSPTGHLFWSLCLCLHGSFCRGWPELI